MHRRTAVAAGVLVALLWGTPVWAQTGLDPTLSVQTLLVVTVLLSVCLVVLCAITLWQSHRAYLDTVRLHQTLTEAHQTFLSRALTLLRDTAAGPSARRRSPAASSERDTARSRGPAAPTGRATAMPIPAPGAGVGRPQQKTNGDAPAALAELNDVEFAVLEKLAADPAFFTQHPLHMFGADQYTIDGLLRRGLAKLDALGRPTVQAEVQTALRSWLPRN